MSEKKKGLFSQLFASKKSCDCGVKIVEEDENTKTTTTDQEKKEK